MANLPITVVYCPRCDKPFVAANRALGWTQVLAHIKVSHPDYLPMVEED